MITILCITAFFILLYLLYPVWLSLSAPAKKNEDPLTFVPGGVSVILLSYNGMKYLEKKINCLLTELSVFPHAELVVVDDASTDGSPAWLQLLPPSERLVVILNPGHRGIPFSMNRAVSLSRYDVIIFCDQRQELSEGCLSALVGPLSDERIGAVSGCISVADRENRRSFIRMHENCLKLLEGRTGSLIGVYGPCYAIRKECYSPIPDAIILDDLYLSLKILHSKKVLMLEPCRIVDDNLSVIYGYRRARRYLSGLLQVLSDPEVMKGLSARHRLMLIWHKYLRLVIPPLIFLCWLFIGLEAVHSFYPRILFILLTAALLFALLPVRLIPRFRLKNLIRMNFFYFVASLDILVRDIILPSPLKTAKTP